MYFVLWAEELLRAVGARVGSTRESTGTSWRCFLIFAVLDKLLDACAAASPFHAFRIADGSIVAIG